MSIDKLVGGGSVGADGKDAYQVWVDEGGAGTKQDFLDSLGSELTLASAFMRSESLPVVSKDQFLPATWTPSAGSTVSDARYVTLKSNGGQVRLQVPSALTVGEEYLAVLNITNIEWGDPSCAVLAFYNFSQQLTDLRVNKSDGATDVFLTGKFTATASNYLQLVAFYTTSIASDLDLIKFQVGMVSVAPWSQSLEDTLTTFAKTYRRGVVHPLQTLFVPDESGGISADSFTILNEEVNRVRNTQNEPLITNYANLASSSVNTITHGDTLDMAATLESTAAPAFTSFNYGFQIGVSLFATSTKTYVAVMAGTVTATNLQEGRVGFNDYDRVAYIEDVADNTPTEFAVSVEHTFAAGSTDPLNERYVFFRHTPKNAGADITVDYSLSTYAIFEKVVGFTTEDYIRSVGAGTSVPKYLPATAATQAGVDSTITALKNDLTAGVVATEFSADMSHDVHMLIMYGQSLSVGGQASAFGVDKRNTLSFQGGNNEWDYGLDITDTTQVNNFYGTDLVQLQSVPAFSYGPVNSATHAWIDSLETNNGIDFAGYDYQFLLSSPGQSGASITELNKGTGFYDRLLFSVQKGHELSLKAGKTFSVPVLFWVQGEADLSMTQAAYYALMSTLFTDLNTDIKAVTGQSDDVKFITYQVAPNDAVASGPAYAQLQMALENNNVYGATGMYQFRYADAFHPVDRTIVGLQLGVIAKKVLSDNNPPPVFYPTGHDVQVSGSDFLVKVDYAVPVKPARFSTEVDEWHNVNGIQPNYGFKILNGAGTDIISALPVVKRGSSIVFRCSEDPTGATLQYAINGHAGGGNLCDSQNLSIESNGTTYRVDNFAPAFDNYVLA